MTVGTWFRTDYDESVLPAALPMELTSGMDPAVTIVDQMLRGQAIVGRVTGHFGAVAVKVRGTGRPVRVTVSIGLDEAAARMWADRTRPSRLAPELPRLVAIRAQGLIRGGAVLARRPGWRRAVSTDATLAFDVTADEVGPDGLIILELAETPCPSWAAGQLSAHPVVGLRINSIKVRDQASATRTVGPSGFSGCGFAVVQPGTPIALRLETIGVPFAAPVARNPQNRLTRQKPVRAVFKVLRAARRVAVRMLPYSAGEVGEVLAVDLSTGEPVAVEVVRHSGGADIRFAEPVTRPVLLGAADPRPTRSWRLTSESP